MSTTLEAPAKLAPEMPAPDAGSEDDAPTTTEHDHDQEHDQEQERAANKPRPARPLRRIMTAVAVVALLGGMVVAVIGFALSYRSLQAAALGWGFGPDGARAFPIGIDGGVIAFGAIDLLLVWRRMPRPLLRHAAHLLTAVTIALNISAAINGQNIWSVLTTDPGRVIGHATMPVLFVLCVGAARHAVVRTGELEDGTGGIPAHRWLMDPRGTMSIFRTMRVWDVPYAEVREQRRELAIHQVWKEHREDIEAGRLEALPGLLAPHGLTVEEALAMPARMRRAEQERQQVAEREARILAQEAEAEKRAAEQEARLAALEAEAEALRAQGEVDVLRATVEGERKAAEHRAEAAADTAGIEASAARNAAERRATEEERRAEAEQEAQETAQTAALRRRAAEDNRKAAEAEDATARTKAEAAARLRKAAEDNWVAKRAEEEAADKEEAAQAARGRAAAHREAVARAELAAVAAEDAARLSERERTIRRVARMILVEAGGTAIALPLARIEEVFGVSNGTASGYRSDAADLIERGYDHRTDPLHVAAYV
ncbi:DUF2637 domain-containing protein [Streptomyces sioyaensis]|uniref:DUF2637 domain-containing protein n=1 Tax=Streptomyces sioyaensis TaxID=67364 RepID=UPI0037B84FAD